MLPLDGSGHGAGGLGRYKCRMIKLLPGGEEEEKEERVGDPAMKLALLLSQVGSELSLPLHFDLQEELRSVWRKGWL